jgi:hypothetical protein
VPYFAPGCKSGGLHPAADDAVATAIVFFACGSAEMDVLFRCFGGFAAKTTE